MVDKAGNFVPIEMNEQIADKGNGPLLSIILFFFFNYENLLVWIKAFDFHYKARKSIHISSVS